MVEVVGPRVYVAGPVRAKSKYEVEVNIRRAEDLGLLVMKMGAVAVVPHTMYRNYGEGDLTDEFLLAACIALLSTCQAMAIDVEADRARASEGTTGEIGYSEAHSIRIFPAYDEEGQKRLAEWVTEWKQQQLKEDLNRRHGQVRQIALDPRTTYKVGVNYQVCPTCGRLKDVGMMGYCDECIERLPNHE